MYPGSRLITSPRSQSHWSWPSFSRSKRNSWRNSAGSHGTHSSASPPAAPTDRHSPSDAALTVVVLSSAIVTILPTQVPRQDHYREVTVWLDAADHAVRPPRSTNVPRSTKALRSVMLPRSVTVPRDSGAPA